MELLKPCSAPNKRAKTTGATTDDGVLSPDILSEILLRLPAKCLCRFRAVSRLWRALISDPLLIADHASRQPGLLLVAGLVDDDLCPGGYLAVMDSSGNVIKLIRSAESIAVVPTRLDLVCVAEKNQGARVLDPATGEVFLLPEEPAEEHGYDKGEFFVGFYPAYFGFGRVASTGEYKVLRILLHCLERRLEQLCEVLTLGSDDGGRWRGKKSPPVRVCSHSSMAAVNGVVYFLQDCEFAVLDLEPDCIASFDLETEEWRATLRGPLSSLLKEKDEMLDDGHRSTLALAELKGSLVVVHMNDDVQDSHVDLWFLMDYEKGLWAREYRIEVQPQSLRRSGFSIQPLSVLDDGRIVLLKWPEAILQVYVPKTGNFMDGVYMPEEFCAISIYTGSLLRLKGG